MKLLLVADLHYTLRQWDWLKSVADQFDLIVIAGDLLDIASIVSLEAQIVVIRKYLQRLAPGSPVLVSSGNHDVLSQTEGQTKTAAWLQQERRDKLFVDGDRYEQDGLFFSLLPWWETEDDVARIEALLEEHAISAAGKRWIWIYHPPPAKQSVAWNGRADWGDQHARRWIERFKPEMVLSGHVHQAPFVRNGAWIDVIDGTWLFNSGRQPGSVPTFTVIDTEKDHAIWISTEDAQQARLIQPLECQPLDGPIRL